MGTKLFESVAVWSFLAVTLELVSINAYDCPSGDHYFPSNSKQADDRYFFAESYAQLFLDLTIKCDEAVITEWHFTSATPVVKGLHLAVFRPRQESGRTMYFLVGDTYVDNYYTPSLQWLRYEPQSPIAVIKGDIIGIYYDHIDMPRDLVSIRSGMNWASNPNTLVFDADGVSLSRTKRLTGPGTLVNRNPSLYVALSTLTTNEETVSLPQSYNALIHQLSMPSNYLDAIAPRPFSPHKVSKLRPVANTNYLPESTEPQISFKDTNQPFQAFFWNQNQRVHRPAARFPLYQSLDQNTVHESSERVHYGMKRFPPSPVKLNRVQPVKRPAHHYRTPSVSSAHEALIRPRPGEPFVYRRQMTTPQPIVRTTEETTMEPIYETRCQFVDEGSIMCDNLSVAFVVVFDARLQICREFAVCGVASQVSFEDHIKSERDLRCRQVCRRSSIEPSTKKHEIYNLSIEADWQRLKGPDGNVARKSSEWRSGDQARGAFMWP